MKKFATLLILVALLVVTVLPTYAAEIDLFRRGPHCVYCNSGNTVSVPHYTYDADMPCFYVWYACNSCGYMWSSYVDYQLHVDVGGVCRACGISLY